MEIRCSMKIMTPNCSHSALKTNVKPIFKKKIIAVIIFNNASIIFNNVVIIFKRYGKKQMEMEGVDNPSVADKNRSLKNAVKLEGMNDV